MSIIAKLVDSVKASYTKMVVAELNNYGKRKAKMLLMYDCHVGLNDSFSHLAGLRYQDLFIEDDAVTKAVHHLPPEEQLARERRIKRAIEISLKKKYLPYEIQKVQEPLKVS